MYLIFESLKTLDNCETPEKFEKYFPFMINFLYECEKLLYVGDELEEPFIEKIIKKSPIPYEYLSQLSIFQAYLDLDQVDRIDLSELKEVQSALKKVMAQVNNLRLQKQRDLFANLITKGREILQGLSSRNR